MKPRQFFALWTSLFIALAVTAGAFYVEKSRIMEKGEAWGIQWARQWSTQIKNLSELGESLGKKDTIQWAIKQFRKKNINSHQKIYLAKIPRLPHGKKEDYRFDYWNGNFDYAKILSEESNQAVRILIEFPYQGFMGAPSAFWNLAYLMIFFLLVMGFSYLFTIRVPRYEPPKEKLKREIKSWVGATQGTLVDFGKSLSDLKSQLDSMTLTYRRADQSFDDASHGILPMSRRFKEIAMSLRGLSIGFLSIKKISDRFKKEALGFGEDGKILAGTAQEMNFEFQRLMLENKKIQQNLVYVLKEAAKWQRSFEIIKAHAPKTSKISEEIQKDLKQVSIDLYRQAYDIKKLNQIIKKVS